MKLQLTVRSCSPLALSASRANEQFAQGLDYIPASALRGALAASYLQEERAAADEMFQALFQSDQVKYPDLLPTLSDTATSAVFPVTAQACKRYKLRHPESLEDTLLHLAAQSAKLQAWEQSPGLILEELLERKYCPTCQAVQQHSPLFRLTRYYTLDGSEGDTIRPVQVYRRLIAGTSISRATGTVEHGMLFSRDVLEEDQYFAGQIWLAGDAAEDLEAQLRQLLPPDGVLRVGYGRSRGLGKLEIVKCEPAADSGPDLAQRWEKFNEKARSLGLAAEREYFSLTLASDWIRSDDQFHVPDSLPEGSELGIPDAKRHRCVVEATMIMGWNAVLGLPKESQPALKRGSVLLYSVPGEKAGAAQVRLQTIEREGLGERRNEGFGRISVCHPFHYESLRVEG
jgi:CRISPR-associated protein Csx10